SASIASPSSGPSVSSVMRLPFPAASIITPMMLLAFTLRPLRESDTSHWYFAASCVSLADARACIPSLLTISTSCCRIQRIDLDVQNSVATSADRLLGHGVEVAVAIGERTHQHGQVHAGDELDPTWDQQLAREITWGRAVNVREDENPFA